MQKKLPAIFSTMLLSVVLSSGAFAGGEGLLALKGEYSFFINPEPGSCVTYYQKMVPCIAKETIFVPKKVVRTLPLPVPTFQRQPILRSEIPVGCAEGAGPCVECAPKPVCGPGYKNVLVPKMIPVRVPTVEWVPKCVTRKVWRPQWFAVNEVPRPPKKIRKVGAGG